MSDPTDAQIRLGLMNGDGGEHPCVFCDAPTDKVGMVGIGLVQIRRPVCERCVDTGVQLAKVIQARHGKKG